MDGIVDRICVDTTTAAGAVRVNVAGAAVVTASWLADAWQDLPDRRIAEARGVRRWCFRDISTTTRSTSGFSYVVETSVAEGGPGTDRVEGWISCAETPARHVGLDGRGGALTLDLDGRPRAIAATRRGLRYHEWTGSRWREEWIHCLGAPDGSPAGTAGCPAAPDWTHDYALEAGLTLDHLQRPVACFVHGERTLLEEEVFGDRMRYAQPATPMAEARGTAYLAWRFGSGWRTRALGRVGRAGLWGCSIAPLNLRPDREEYLVSWAEEVPGPHGSPVTWPHMVRVVGPETHEGDFRIATPAVVPPIWSQPVVCGDDAVCGVGHCERTTPGVALGTCVVSEVPPADDAEDALSAHFTSVAGALFRNETDRFLLAFDTAGGRIWLAELEGPGCACPTSGGGCCATSVAARVLGPTPEPVADALGTGLENSHRYGLRPHLAVRANVDNAGFDDVAISFSARRRDDHNRPGRGDGEGWTPAVFHRGRALVDFGTAAWWPLIVHEDALAKRSGLKRLWTATQRLPASGLPTWVGFEQDGALRFAYGLDGVIVPADESNIVAAAPLQGVFGGAWIRDTDDTTWPVHVQIEGVVQSHLGLAAALSGGDRLRLLFHNAMSPLSLGAARPVEGDPADWDLRILGSAHYFEEESGTQFGRPMWGSSRYPCYEPPCEGVPEPDPPAEPVSGAACKELRFYETRDEAAVSDAEISLVPTLTPSLRRLASTDPEDLDELKRALFGGDPASICAGGAGAGVLHDVAAVGGEDLRKLFCDGDAPQSSQWLNALARGLRYAAGLVWRFENGGTMPLPTPADWPGRLRRLPGRDDGADPDLVVRSLPPNTPLMSFVASGLRLRQDRPLLRSEQHYVCVNDDATRRSTSLQERAEPMSEPTVYRAEPVPRYAWFADFAAATPYGFDGSLESFESYCGMLALEHPPGGAETGYDPAGEVWPGATIRVTRVVLRSPGPGDAPQHVCVACPGDAVIDDDGVCHGCERIRRPEVGERHWLSGLRAHLRGWVAGGQACVEWDPPSKVVAADTGLAEEPFRKAFRFDPEGGVWHACPAGPEAPPTIPFHCLSDEQCTSRGEGFEDWRCVESTCRPPVRCASDDDCAEGYACLPGDDWGIRDNICRRPVPCEEYVGGICAPEGACRGRTCEQLVLGCPQTWFAGGGGASCSSGDSHLTPLPCTNLRPIQFSAHEYLCVETVAVTCREDRYCLPDDLLTETTPTALRCIVGSRCEASAGDPQPWCAARELVNDAELLGIVAAKADPEHGILEQLKLLAGDPPAPEDFGEFAGYEQLNALSQVLNEDTIRWAMEDLGASLTIPPAEGTFDEELLPPEIFWRENRLANGAAVQGELVVSIGQDDGGFHASSCGSSFRIIDAPWRLQVVLQPYYHEGSIVWRLQRMPLVNPGTGAEPGYESCACDGVREARNTVEGGLNPFGAVLEPIAGMVWRLVADEASAPLAFGNWSLLETLDRLHAVPGRDPAVDTDGVPDEVIGIRILDGTASVRALERR